MRVQPVGNYSKDLEIEAFNYLVDATKNMNKEELFNDFKCFSVLKTRELMAVKSVEIKIAEMREFVLQDDEIKYEPYLIMTAVGTTGSKLIFPVSTIFDDGESIIITYTNNSILYHAVMALIENEDLTYAELNQKRFDPEE